MLTCSCKWKIRIKHCKQIPDKWNILCVLLLRIEVGQAVRYCVCLDKVWDVRMACLDMAIYGYLDSLQWIHLFTPEKAFHRTYEILSVSPSVEPSSSQTPPVFVPSTWCSLSGVDSHGSSVQLQLPWGASTCSVWGPTGSAGESVLQCLEHLFLLLLHWPWYQQNCFSHMFSLLLPAAIGQGLNTLSHSATTTDTDGLGLAQDGCLLCHTWQTSHKATLVAPTSSFATQAQYKK